ncbi:MAG: hypothetical protein RLZZ381_2787 [Cyanobacteriota bacterium]|jgi:hypothetical protein
MTNKALLCGINNYQSQTDLRGCINDIEEIHRLLIDKFHFVPSDIHQLKNEEVTKSKIQNEWQWLLEGAESGDRPVLVNNWYNLDAKGDLVGGMLQGKFAITEEFLELEPTECDRGLLGYNLGCAHTSYFKENNLAVNRDILARLINKK